MCEVRERWVSEGVDVNEEACACSERASLASRFGGHASSRYDCMAYRFSCVWQDAGAR